jgi:MFS transporter, DHA1 family, inner membrane transport protein
MFLRPAFERDAAVSLPLLALFFAAFGIGTGEFVIAGLLPDVSQGLAVSIPDAGYLITAYALGIAIGGPITALALRRLDRRTALLLILGVFTLGQALCAVSPSFLILLLVRFFIAFTHGAYFGVAAIVATRLAPPEKRGSAVALLLAGITVANILGVPAGTAIGNTLGWRATFWAVGGLTLVALLGVAAFVPRAGVDDVAAPDLRSEVRVLLRQPVYLSFAVIIVAIIGQFALFSYIAPLLISVTGIDANAVPWLLLLIGLGSTIGVLLGGRLADWRLMPTLVGTLVLQVVVYALIGTLVRSPMAMAVLLLVWGGACFAFGAPAQARILRWASDAPNFVSPLIPTAFNIGIAIGATIGSIALEHGFGYAALPWIGVVVVLLSLVIALLSWSMERRTAAPALS